MVDVANMTIEARMGWCKRITLYCGVSFCGGVEIWKSPEAVVF
jgi:hypothetical protein